MWIWGIFVMTTGTDPVPLLGRKMKKSISVLLLFIFSIISWIIWIIEVNPFITNTWDWIDEKRITFVITPILFLLWAYFSRLITRIPRIIINLIIFYIFFGILLCLIMIAHIMGPSGLLIIFSPFRFLLYKPISLILISLLTFAFNCCSFKLNKMQLTRKELVILYFSFFSVPLFMFLISCIFNLIKANDWIIGFFGFNNMDSILWFKSGIIIPISFIYEGIILLGKKNISKSKSSLFSEIK